MIKRSAVNYTQRLFVRRFDWVHKRLSLCYRSERAFYWSARQVHYRVGNRRDVVGVSTHIHMRLLEVGYGGYLFNSVTIMAYKILLS